MRSEVGNVIQQPWFQMLAREGSLCSLTLDEVQNQLGELGKPLGSMNLDELLRTLSASKLKPGLTEPLNDVGTQAGRPESSSRRGSGSHMLSFSRDLVNKTVEEVWKEMQQGKKKRESGNNDGHISFQGSTKGEAQLCFGEMTLEDFLVNAGVMAESKSSHENGSNTCGIDPVPVPVQHAQWMQCHHPFSVQQHQPHQDMMTVLMPGLDINQLPIPVGSCPVLDGRTAMPQENGGTGVAPENVAVKIVERKHKRMLKNRESAARSRARRQAYTQELENKIRHLEEENEMLRRLQGEDDNMLPSKSTSTTKSKLRRTSSASF